MWCPVQSMSTIPYLPQNELRVSAWAKTYLLFRSLKADWFVFRREPADRCRFHRPETTHYPRLLSVQISARKSWFRIRTWIFRSPALQTPPNTHLNPDSNTGLSAAKRSYRYRRSPVAPPRRLFPCEANTVAYRLLLPCARPWADWYTRVWLWCRHRVPPAPNTAPRSLSLSPSQSFWI